ncbi:RNA polymerase sigma factor [Bradyrhizobium viridifuturi]|jgi:RNA polymerase sigma-70 factor (ECF subfamily)|uniref:RNA polymerase sigma factor n=1 Tax=Bradyrhizobium TaxID=374 RepID=UPI000AAAA73E|nr:MULTISPECIES: RNA polymerase sigma factor [Bradyrhizobium]QRI69002.1 RNA polymerase sigma factor [Bradyrhizobium sp. PSBB068]MBR1025268.1 RNA polymerase sigma factor [Bradyrhizobium viridifuturi]MBR1037227.1 RNA polymerase sigma factor [Bradyrhizobium viridifuturi]MBR1049038.1 RNA polymerase sigma factor [Bradyrhizobium viridifuturi]MBR1074498.1 RNA polymerase sigma factor [Bradyrhizobium viridifuturi]
MKAADEMSEGESLSKASDHDEAADNESARTLRALLIERYQDLKSRLARRLGSLEWAEDALQDTYLRLNGREIVGDVRNPAAYLLRSAFHVALNQRRADNRRLNAEEVEALLNLADDAPDAVRVISGRSDLERLKQVMAELPPRPRAILLAARLEGLSRQQIARRFGISVSLVEKELRRAQEHCVARFKKIRRPE